MNTHALKHPRTLWSIEAACWRAIEESRNDCHGIGIGVAESAQGREIVTARHDRYAIPGFTFWRGAVDVTADVLAVLRGQK